MVDEERGTGGGLGGVEDRHEFLEALLYAADPHLASPRIYSVHRGTIRGQLASSVDGIDRDAIRERRLEVSASPILRGVVSRREPFVGALTEDDPIGDHLDPALREIGRIAVVPVMVRARVACVFFGNPVETDDAVTLEALTEIAAAASRELTSLIRRSQDHTASFPLPDASPEHAAAIRAAKTRAELIGAALDAVQTYGHDPVAYLVHHDHIDRLDRDGRVSKTVVTRAETSMAWTAVETLAPVTSVPEAGDPLRGDPGDDRALTVVPVALHGRCVLLLSTELRAGMTDRVRLAFAVIGFETGLAMAKLLSHDLREEQKRKRPIAEMVLAAITVAGIALLGFVLTRTDLSSVEATLAEVRHDVEHSLQQLVDQGTAPPLR